MKKQKEITDLEKTYQPHHTLSKEFYQQLGNDLLTFYLKIKRDEMIEKKQRSLSLEDLERGLRALRKDLNEFSSRVTEWKREDMIAIIKIEDRMKIIEEKSK